MCKASAEPDDWEHGFHCAALRQSVHFIGTKRNCCGYMLPRQIVGFTFWSFDPWLFFPSRNSVLLKKVCIEHWERQRQIKCVISKLRTIWCGNWLDSWILILFMISCTVGSKAKALITHKDRKPCCIPMSFYFTIKDAFTHITVLFRLLLCWWLFQCGLTLETLGTLWEG